MLIKKEQARKKVNSDSCTVWEYDFPSKSLWFAVWKINWRFPDKWKNLNNECDEVYYILSWTWVINYDDLEYTLNEWDAFFIEKWKRYWVEWNNLLISLATQPARYFEQYQEVK